MKGDSRQGERRKAERSTDPRYPIGPFVAPEVVSADDRLGAISVLAELPDRLRHAVNRLDHHQLATPYREGGWTLRQVVHHVADSHMMAFIRMRLALTEDWPKVPSYDEAACSRLHDSSAPVEWSLELVESLHARWVMLLQSLKEEQWQRGFVHSAYGRTTVDLAAQEYAWHSRHHVAHIMHLRYARHW
ncbi:YfiT family bacillithiol transferase [Granulicella tundricola]|uniref:DinB-like domain-containing protein n=1 Tax=Granulicella tundricola (strain ATCC BAA-1859 / DSM 23138 / MP5ACTX9) TaxID=1198114 RepID=E8X2T8_GRATM|nr:putative metal-dependent hydrolase [Granulicella tundricola]ADW70385.1 hypothetical protein AciX9_3377 [Granulicella tundricola MP5ACTX9]